MDVDDLQKLYSELRGSRSGPAVMDARAHFLERQMQDSLASLREAHATYQESRQRILKKDPDKDIDKKDKDADRQIRRMKRQQDKARELLKTFEHLISQLEKLADREQKRLAEKAAKDAERAKVAGQQAKQTAAEEPQETEAPTAQSETSDEKSSASQRANPSPSSATKTGSSATRSVRLSSLTGAFLDEFGSLTGDRQLTLVSSAYGFRQLQSISDVVSDAIYLMHDSEHSYLFTASEDAINGDQLQCTDAVTGDLLGPVSREGLVQFSEQRKLVMLTESTTPEDENHVNEERDRVLDMGAFSQLMDSAQRSGLCPGADQIGHVRDKEFRKGNYDLALQTIENLFGKFSSAAQTRTQKLQREDADIAAGRIKISPKDLQAKRVRDRAEDQAVERARLRFSRVLNGLRILSKTE